MNWFKKILVSVALVNVAVGPAFAGNLSKQESAKAAQYKEYLEPMGYQVKVDEAKKKVFIYDKNTKQLAMEIPLQEEANLQKYSPKELDRVLLDEMVRVKSAGKEAMSHALKALPSESMIFFLSMGAVVASQLIMDYSQNPVAMKHHIEHQMSPIGAFGFYAFMASQGVTSNVLAMYTSNPRFHQMIPYLGMTVGAFVQSYLSQVISDPNVMACGKQMLGKKVSQQELAAMGADEDPCAKAYEYLVLKKKIWEFAPGIVSMLVSSVLAGAVESAITGVVFQLTGFDIALMLMPGSMQLKGLRLMLVKGLQIAIFVSIDAWMSRKVNAAWKNFFDGNDFNAMNDRLNLQVNTLKNNQWAGSSVALRDELKNFRKKMTDWRLMNMSDIYEAHQAWQENLFQLTSMYNSSYSFYNSFINEVRNIRFNQQIIKPLLITYPLNGVTAKGLQAGRGDLYLQSPKMVENSQADTVYDAVDKIDQFVKSVEYKSLLLNEKGRLKKIRDLLNSDDHMQMGQGLDWLNFSIKEASDTLVKSDRYVQLLQSLKNSMGRPDPKFQAGQGYLSAFELAPTTGDSVKGTPYYRQVGNMATPTISEYLLMQMICGPDLEKGESAVRTSLGYPAVFLPPQLKSESDKFGALCDTLGRPKYNAANIYIFPVKNSADKKYQGFISYLIDNSRGSVVGAEAESAFPQWWTRNTEPQMQKAFDKFSRSYESIVAGMIRKIYVQDRTHYSNIFEKFLDKIESGTKNLLDKEIWGAKGSERADKSTFNRGPISNGAMNSAFQEERTYLSILEDILKPSGHYALNLQTILTKAPVLPELKAVEAEFLKMNDLIKQIKIVQKEGRESIESPLENYQIDEQLENIQAALTDLSNKLGVAEGEQAQAAVVQLTTSQKEIIVSCLQNLQALASEVSMFGKIANAVSWDKIRNLKQINIQKNEFNNEIQKKLASMRGLLSAGK